MLLKRLATISLFTITVLSVTLPKPTSGSSAQALDETICDDNQDNLIRQFILDGALITKSTIENKLADGTPFRCSTAFTNCFEDSDFDIVNKMFSAISGYVLDINDALNLWFLCGPEQPPCKQLTDLSVYADPDPTPWTNEATQWYPLSGLRSYDRFFYANNTEINFHYLSKTDEEWCKGETLKGFKTSGFLSAMTMAETDAFGRLAGLPTFAAPKGSGLYPRNLTHGALKLYREQADGSYEALWKTARFLKKAWASVATDANVPRPPIARVQSSPSYAAAATEFYFLSMCGKGKFDSIPE